MLYVSHLYGYNFLGKGRRIQRGKLETYCILRKIVEEGPGPLTLSDISRDNITATAGDGYYIVYFGKQVSDNWLFNLPAKNSSFKKLTAGTKFKVEIIDSWEMTIEQVPLIFETSNENDDRLLDKELRKVRLPSKPYIALRITEIK